MYGHPKCNGVRKHYLKWLRQMRINAIFKYVWETHFINSHNDSLGMISPEGGKGSYFCFLFYLQDIASRGSYVEWWGRGHLVIIQPTDWKHCKPPLHFHSDSVRNPGWVVKAGPSKKKKKKQGPQKACLGRWFLNKNLYLKKDGVLAPVGIIQEEL